jgi:hypothetical protein
MSIEAMKQALEALEEIYRTGDTQAFDLCYAPNVIPALRQAIAEAEQEPEPVAWMTINEYGEEDDIHYENPEGHLLEGWTYKPLYTHPPSVQPEGWVKIDEVREHFNSVGCGTIYKTAGEDRVPLYTTPLKREWVELTDKQIDDIMRPLTQNQPYSWRLFARAIEAKLKEKNT